MLQQTNIKQCIICIAPSLPAFRNHNEGCRRVSTKHVPGSLFFRLRLVFPASLITIYAENKRLRSEGDDRLKGTRQLWLYNEDNLDEDRYHELLTAMRNDLKTGRAWAIKENFRHFWTYVYAFSAEGFFARWYGWAIRSRLDPIKKVARMLKEHLGGMLSYFRHRITNAITEGFNSRIQSIKSAARGFRNFANYRLRVLFYCGKLEMAPDGCH